LTRQHLILWGSIGKSMVWCLGLAACASGELPSEQRPRLGSVAEPLVTDASGARADADAGTGNDAGAGPSNDCCTPSGSGGCADDTVEACVCAGDPFCCAIEYDALCAKQAVSRCGLDCDDRPPASDCCGPSDVPGCSEPAVAACICDIDPFCCVFRFDQSCVSLGASRCGAVCEGVEP
jgi:hypothetical protein